jgi:PIN domain
MRSHLLPQMRYASLPLRERPLCFLNSDRSLSPKKGILRFLGSRVRFTLLETLVMPLRKANTDLIARYEAMLLSSEISLIPINQAILKAAARIRSTTNLKTPDAIHAATALNLGAATQTKRFRCTSSTCNLLYFFSTGGDRFFWGSRVRFSN